MKPKKEEGRGKKWTHLFIVTLSCALVRAYLFTFFQRHLLSVFVCSLQLLPKREVEGGNSFWKWHCNNFLRGEENMWTPCPTHIRFNLLNMKEFLFEQQKLSKIHLSYFSWSKLFFEFEILIIHTCPLNKAAQ